MLGLYLYTHIIGQKSCNILSILNKLALQKRNANFVTSNLFLDNKKIHINNKTKQNNIKTLAGAGN